MTIFTETKAEIGGVATRVLNSAPRDGAPLVFLHGGRPGISPYAAGMHLWGSTLDELTNTRQVVMIDMLASGGTGAGNAPLRVDAIAAHVVATLENRGQGRVHLIGHELGGLVALFVAMDRPDLLASVGVIASEPAAPVGDTIQNLSLLSPPAPRLGAASQFWAFDRLSYSHHHIDDALIKASVENAGDVEKIETLAGQLPVSIREAKLRIFKVAREEGVKVPIQLIWGRSDPSVTIEQGLVLYGVLCGKQRVVHFNVVNRAGNFPFREQPEEFRRIVSAFVDGLDRETAH